MLNIYEKNWVSYSKSLSHMTGSIVASVFLQQVIEIYKIRQENFILFDKPTTSNHYHTGLSWQERVGMSPDDIKYALTYIGSRISKTQPREEILEQTRPMYNIHGRLINAPCLVLYKSAGPYCKEYELNHLLLESSIISLHDGTWKKYLVAPGTSFEKERINYNTDDINIMDIFNQEATDAE